MTNLMTESETWEFLAAKWENPVQAYSVVSRTIVPAVNISDIHSFGLCGSICALRNENLINNNCLKNMIHKLEIYRKQHYIGDMYYWPRDLEGAKQRVAFCKEQIEKLKLLMNG